VPEGYFVGINWNNDGVETGGDFTDVGEDVTEDVLAKDPVTFQYGRDKARALSPPRVGSIGFSLCNTDGLFSPDNPNSPISADVSPAAPIKVTETINGVEYGLMRGRIDNFEITSHRRDRSVQITGLDDLALLRGNRITLPMYRAERTGRLIVAILDEIGWFNAGRDIDFGASFLPYFWANNEDAFDLVTKLLRAEGPPAVAYVDPNGTFVFRDRHHRLLRSQSLTSQGTFEVMGLDCDSPPVTGTPYIDPFEYEIGWRDIVNDVRIDVTERSPDPSFSTVWESNDTIALTTGQSVTIPVTTQEPFVEAQDITAAAGDIIYTGPGTPSILLSERSGQSTSIRITAVGGNVTVTYLRLRARSVPVARTVQVIQTDSTSIVKHGDRTYPDDVPFVSREDALAVALVLLEQYAERRPTVSVRLVSNTLATHLQIVQRTISDLVTVRYPDISLNANFFIENIQHTLRRMATVQDCPGPVHYATFGCEQAGDVVVVNPFTFDKVGAGFDDGVFASSVADDPATIFIFDHATQGQFDVGVFGT
jgi:hypothetical protein